MGFCAKLGAASVWINNENTVTLLPKLFTNRMWDETMKMLIARVTTQGSKVQETDIDNAYL